MRLQRTGPTLPTDCIPEEYTPLEQDFWAMRYIADELRWEFGAVVQRITRFHDDVRAYWYRVEMEPDADPPVIDYPPWVGLGGFKKDRRVEMGERCHWPRYKTLDVPVSYGDHKRHLAEIVVRGYRVQTILKEGGME